MTSAASRDRGLTAVAGLKVGHHTLAARPTGCTVVLCGPEGTVCGVDVRGAAPGTRETELLSPFNTVERVHALVLAGGSAFGLDTAGGVMRWLDERGIGLPVGPKRADGRPVTVPIVPAAILFDLWVGDASIRPGADAGYAACADAHDGPVEAGSVGAGAGASVGKLFGIEHAMRGGVGSASLVVDGVTVAALVVVNAIGDVRDPATGRLVAGARDPASGAFLDTMGRLRRGDWPPPMRGTSASRDATTGAATTLAIVATDAVLDKARAGKVAQMAHDGLARTITPVHTGGDGDIVFTLATGASGRSLPAGLVGALAADVLAGAVLDAVRSASTLRAPGLPVLRAAQDPTP